MKPEDIESEFEPTEPYEFFQKELKEYLVAYKANLSQTLTKGTVHKHAQVISYCIDYLACYHSVAGFEDITFSMISSKMYYDFESNCQEGMSRKHVFGIIKKFFIYIEQEYGVSNPVLMKKIRNAKV